MDCEHGLTIWSDRFAGEAVDILELQNELSARVATITPRCKRPSSDECSASGQRTSHACTSTLFGKSPP